MSQRQRLEGNEPGGDAPRSRAAVHQAHGGREAEGRLPSQRGGRSVQCVAGGVFTAFRSEAAVLILSHIQEMFLFFLFFFFS